MPIYSEVYADQHGAIRFEWFVVFRGQPLSWHRDSVSLGTEAMSFLPQRQCLSWHRDPEPRIHIPIITHVGCKMVIEDEAFHMPANGSAYVTNNTKYHNFFNGSEIDRVHIVATLLKPFYT